MSEQLKGIYKHDVEESSTGKYIYVYEDYFISSKRILRGHSYGLNIKNLNYDFFENNDAIKLVVTAEFI